MPEWLRPTDICVVTGGCSGLGAAIVKSLGAAGCPTVALDIVIPDDEKAPQASANAQDVAGSAEGPDACSPHEDSLSIIGMDTTRPAHSSTAKGHGPVEAAVARQGEESTKANGEGDDPPTETSGNEQPVSEDVDHIEQYSNDSDTAEERLRPSLTIRCDVRSQEDLARAREQIFNKFQRYPTVLVCNAGVRSPLSSIASTNFADIEDTIEVNLSGPLKSTRTFLPDMLGAKRGFVVTIGSALGLVCPKGLSVYGASKAGVLGFHEALEQEVAPYKHVHALLVCPGQIDTAMFADIQTPSERIAPVVGPDKLAQKIVKRLKKGKTATVYSPTYVRYLPLLRAMPVSMASLARKWSGVDKVYDDMVARQELGAAALRGESADTETFVASVAAVCADTSRFDVTEPKPEPKPESELDPKLEPAHTAEQSPTESTKVPEKPQAIGESGGGELVVPRVRGSNKKITTPVGDAASLSSGASRTSQ